MHQGTGVNFQSFNLFVTSFADDFIQKLPDKYDALLGENGLRLSGGEKQRISIARALLANPRIIILDEATSNLDTESESFIQKSLGILMKDRTTFIIAHRLSTIINADTIYYLDGGNLIEKGSYQELMDLKGKFYELAARQIE